MQINLYNGGMRGKLTEIVALECPSCGEPSEHLYGGCCALCIEEDLSECEGCGQRFAPDLLRSETPYGPRLCCLCVESEALDREHYRATSEWVNRNR